jgi:GNAT superfamily N-acetyltransferase
MYAMENVSIRPFNHETDKEPVLNIFTQEFSTLPAAVTRHRTSRKEWIDVAVRRYRITRSNRPDSLLGFIIYQAKSRAVADSQIPYCPATIELKKMKGAKIEWLLVDSKQRGKGLGALLLKKAEETAIQNDIDYVYLTSVSDAQHFYKKQQYSQPEHNNPTWLFMMKKLNK